MQLGNWVTNLYYLQDAFHCNVTGIDICKSALDIAKEEIWKGRDKYQFHLENVLSTDFFEKVSDGYYDIIITRWHLIHVPLSEAKKSYVESLKRISKVLIVIEPSKDDYHEVDLYHDGHYALSWDDWISEYGLTEYKSEKISKWDDGTKIFYY